MVGKNKSKPWMKHGVFVASPRCFCTGKFDLMKSPLMIETIGV